MAQFQCSCIAYTDNTDEFGAPTSDNFELSNYWVCSEKSEELKNLLKINNLNFDTARKYYIFFGYLTVADEEKYKENIKIMNILIIKISSNNPKVVKYGCR
ncbi:hypothetical protein H8356DRAFT_1437452 [Neocallimastix lanati (nom. inval.)]|nr:hypothetical protein H8356DRAFT_1437452 [Neocallimastix sp. JGI-2020a]